MNRQNEKLLDAKFHQERCGLMWIETTDKDILNNGEFSAPYTCWLLVERATDRMIASIDEPYSDKLCYWAAFDNGVGRKFISLEGAKRYAVGAALKLIESERVDRTRSRKFRRMERVH